MSQQSSIPPVNPLLSQAETREGGPGCAVGQGSRPTRVPDFPVKDWDRYEFLGFLGQGGMGMVFLARDRRLGREVAIKFVHLGDDRHVERFLLEARAQARVDHEHVCKVFEVGEVEGRVFIAMQRIAGSSLETAMGSLSLEQKVIAMRNAARGVHEAHRMGIIHRDLKPSNIMVENGEDGCLRTFVMDFGLAHDWNQDVTETGSVLGTPAYMSPEQARGEVSGLDRRTDLYSLGATLYHLVSGHPPVKGTNPLEVISAIATDEIPTLRSLGLDTPKDLEAITLKCLEKERSRRYDSARALADDLDHFLAGEPVRARPTGFWYRTQRRIQKHRWLALAGAMALAVVVLALGSAIKSRKDAARRERLAQQFTEAMDRIESMTRYSALSPLHDIRPDLHVVRAYMDQLQADMKQAGALAKGPGHYALGRGFLTLDDEEKAREHLQMAWDAGFREPRVAYSLAVVLGRQYQEKLLEAERISSLDQREARKRDIEVALQAQALSFLQKARGSDGVSPVYLESLMASYRGDLDEALVRLKAVESELPWFFEAPLLRGSLLQTRAWKRWNQGERDGAHADFEAGRVALGRAAAIGRSAPSVHAALAELELNALIMEKYGQGQVEPTFLRGMAAVKTALAAQADHVPSLILESALLGHLADFKTSRSEPTGELVQQAVAAAKKALEAGPRRADTWIALGMAYYQWGNARLDQNLDPTDQLAKGLQAFESLSEEKRDYTVENHVGLIHQTWSDFEEQNGRDSSIHLNGAIAAYQRATRLEPHLLPAWINLGTCLERRASLPSATTPEDDLQAALSALDRARALNSKHFVPYFVRGKVLYSLALRKRDLGGNPEPELRQSIEANRQGLVINPEVPHLYYGVGVAELELARAAWAEGGDPYPTLGRARQAFQKAVAIAPNQVLGYLDLGDLLIQKARWEGGSRGLQSLVEAEHALSEGLSKSPGNTGSLVNLGRVHAVRIELGAGNGGEWGRNLIRGEAILMKVLAKEPRNRDAWQYLGELRTASIKRKLLQRTVGPRDFEQASEAFRRALEADPGSQESKVALATLDLVQADWERRMGRDPSPGLGEAQALVLGLLKARPTWPMAMSLEGGINLVEAELLPWGACKPKAEEALQWFHRAFSLNRNLEREWKPMANQAQRLLQ